MFFSNITERKSPIKTRGVNQTDLVTEVDTEAKITQFLHRILFVLFQKLNANKCGLFQSC